VLTLFAGRLVQIQGLESGTYKAQANSEKLITTIIPAPRGNIYGSGGLSQPLAMTIEKYQIVADPTQFPAGPVNSIAAKIGGALGLPAASLVSLINHRASRQYVVLANNVTNAHNDKLTALDLPGIVSKPVFSRAYPTGSPTANLVGYSTVIPSTVDPDNSLITGGAGLEKQYNTLLTGTTGKQQAETGLDGQTIPLAGGEETPAQSGASIRLTIDPTLQFQAQQACQAEVKKTKAANCSVIIMQPKTGDILAMAQWPTYDQDTFTSVDQTEDLPDQYLFDPGSTAKVITAAAALEKGGKTAMSAYKIPYQIYEGGQYIHDAEWHAGEHYTIAGIVANSSNIGMSQVVKSVPEQTQYDYLRKFGLGVPTGLNLPGEAPDADFGNTGALPPPSQWAGDERYVLSFGQGILVNAVQMASVYATIANNGVRVQPRLVQGTYNAAGQYVPAKASPQTKVIQPQTAKTLISILQQVPGVDDPANQRWGDFPGYAVAAKTGTSSEAPQKGEKACPKGNALCIHGSSYIGMAPGNNPQVVVAVNVQNPKTETDYFGDQVAGPVFYSAMNAALQTLKIQPQHGLVAPYVRLNAR
jgi:cell division protein FtsI (penicillin-binding protein 3)